MSCLIYLRFLCSLQWNVICSFHRCLLWIIKSSKSQRLPASVLKLGKEVSGPRPGAFKLWFEGPWSTKRFVENSEKNEVEIILQTLYFSLYKLGLCFCSLKEHYCIKSERKCCPFLNFLLFADEKERFDPTQFQESIVQGLNQTGTDLEAVAKFLDASGAKLDYRRYAETLFDILVAGGMLGKHPFMAISMDWNSTKQSLFSLVYVIIFFSPRRDSVWWLDPNWVLPLHGKWRPGDHAGIRSGIHRYTAWLANSLMFQSLFWIDVAVMATLWLPLYMFQQVYLLS